jgi:purine-nucleoside phosphorylase
MPTLLPPSDPSLISPAALAAAERIAQNWPQRPRFGIILGTGAGNLAEAIRREATFPYTDFSGFPHSTAMGHAGQFVCGQLQGQAVIAMQGRFHLYEGYRVEQSTLGVQTMAALGTKFLLVSNAAGGINPKFRSGEVMLITSHIDLMFRPAPAPETCRSGLRPELRGDSAYDRHNFSVHRGTYCALLGPNYETRSEYRFLRRIGGDTVGMSTVPEVRLAARLGLRVLGLSIVTNVARPDALDPTSGQEVIDAAQVAGPCLRALFENAISANS